jgi:hypothetical protein
VLSVLPQLADRVLQRILVSIAMSNTEGAHACGLEARPAAGEDRSARPDRAAEKRFPVSGNLFWPSLPHETAQLHRTPRRCGSRVAAGGARAATRAHATHWRANLDAPAVLFLLADLDARPPRHRVADAGKGDRRQLPQDALEADFGPLRGAPDDLLSSRRNPFISFQPLALPSLAL